MESDFFKFLETIVALIVAVAIIALLVSPKATTSQVIQASASGLANNLGVAESPVTGATYTLNLSYPNESPFAASPFNG
jgi:PRD1 phage membrane DNA delivery